MLAAPIPHSRAPRTSPGHSSYCSSEKSLRVQKRKPQTPVKIGWSYRDCGHTPVRSPTPRPCLPPSPLPCLPSVCGKTRAKEGHSWKLSDFLSGYFLNRLKVECLQGGLPNHLPSVGDLSRWLLGKHFRRSETQMHNQPRVSCKRNAACPRASGDLITEERGAEEPGLREQLPPESSAVSHRPQDGTSPLIRLLINV